MKKPKLNIGFILFVLGGIPLLIYPFVLLANIMSLAAEGAANEKFLIQFVMKTFMFISASYPFTYIVCLILYKSDKKYGRLLYQSFIY